MMEDSVWRFVLDALSGFIVIARVLVPLALFLWLAVLFIQWAAGSP